MHQEHCFLLWNGASQGGQAEFPVGVPNLYLRNYERNKTLLMKPCSLIIIIHTWIAVEWAFTFFVLLSIETKPASCFQFLPSISWNDGGQVRTCQSFPISYQVTTLAMIQENLCSLAVSYMSSTFSHLPDLFKKCPFTKISEGRGGLFQYKHLCHFSNFFRNLWQTNTGYIWTSQVWWWTKMRCHISAKECQVKTLCVCVVLYPWDYAAL